MSCSAARKPASRGNRGLAGQAPLLAGLCLGGDGRRDSTGAHHGENRILNGVIDPQTAKGDATRLAVVRPAAAAAIARSVMLGARVAKRQLAPATAAAEQARQQSVAALGRAVRLVGTLLLTISRIVCGESSR
jgi:hypothetical protein